ncbi:MAG: HlyD family efflux transporter periplasmic adaptor subunit [Ginsengibacter sp.]
MSKHLNSHPKEFRSTNQSEAVQEFISRKPDFLIRNGTVIFILLLVFIFIACWYMQYPNIVSVPAKLSYITASKPVTYNIPGKNTGYYVQAFIPQEYLSEIKQGQAVLIRFKAFPYQEFGSLRGTLSSVSSTKTDSGYVAKVNLISELKTDHNKQIPFEDGLAGSAQITTGKVRLITRLLSSIFSTKLEKNN